MLRTGLLLVLAATPLLLTACESSTGLEDGARVRIAFTTAAGTAGSLAGVSLSREATGDRVLQGPNGTLTITDVRMIVAEFELEGPDACGVPDEDGELEECEFNAPPSLLRLPLDGDAVVVATDEVPLGTYTELEFEIEDLDEDEDDRERTRAGIADVRSQLRGAFPRVPDEASAVVVGTFTPTGGAPRPFTVYLDADVEVEIDLVPPLVISEQGASRTVTVQLDPARWFVQGGQVLDLSLFNERLLELEDEFELGVVGIQDDD